MSITQLLQLTLMVVSLCALILSTTSAVHVEMGHHEGTFAVEAADGHAIVEHDTTKLADCTSSEQDKTSTDGGLNCCSVMCSAVFLVETVANTASDQQGDHFGLPLQALTSHETHGLLRPPRI